MSEMESIPAQDKSTKDVATVEVPEGTNGEMKSDAGIAETTAPSASDMTINGDEKMDTDGPVPVESSQEEADGQQASAVEDSEKPQQPHEEDKVDHEPTKSIADANPDETSGKADEEPMDTSTKDDAIDDQRKETSATTVEMSTISSNISDIAEEQLTQVSDKTAEMSTEAIGGVNEEILETSNKTDEKFAGKTSKSDVTNEQKNEPSDTKDVTDKESQESDNTDEQSVETFDKTDATDEQIKEASDTKDVADEESQESFGKTDEHSVETFEKTDVENEQVKENEENAAALLSGQDSNKNNPLESEKDVKEFLQDEPEEQLVNKNLHQELDDNDAVKMADTANESKDQESNADEAMDVDTETSGLKVAAIASEATKEVGIKIASITGLSKNQTLVDEIDIDVESPIKIANNEDSNSSSIKIAFVEGSKEDENSIKITSVKGSKEDESSIKIASVEGAKEDESPIKIAAIASANGDVIDIADESSENDAAKKKPVLKLASFAGMSGGDATGGKSSESANDDNAQLPSKHNKVSGCAQCFKIHESILNDLVWETMRFCNEVCLGEYQNTMSNCSTCKKTVSDSLLGKYCVRFGSDIKQFCSNVCLEDHKKGLKVCCYCQKDISGGDGFLAPIGDKGQFKDFCIQDCLQKFEALHCGKKIEKAEAPCAVCSSKRPVEVKLILMPKDNEQKEVQLCSNVCLSAYKFTSNAETSQCNLCKAMFEKVAEEDVQFVIHFGGQTKYFCTAVCQNVYVMQNRDIVPCSWCKVRKYNFDMIEKHKTGQFNHYCSLNCYNTHAAAAGNDPKIAAVSGNATASWNSGQTNSMPVIQSISSLAPRLPVPPVTQAAAPAPPAQAAPVPPPPPQIITQTQVVTKTVTDTVVKVSEGTQMKNKSVMTKPQMLTKGVSCRPHPCHKSTQTDGPSTPALVPVVVPMYMPMPMAMYAKPYPVPIPVPLPIPIPVFIPTSRNTAKGVEKVIKKIRSKVPADPFEAEMLAMAGALVSKKEDSDDDSDDSVAEDLIDDEEDDVPLSKRRAAGQHQTEDLESEIKADKVVPKPLPPVSASPIPMPSPYANRNNQGNRPANQNRPYGKRRHSGDSDDENVDDPSWQNNDWESSRNRKPQTRQRRPKQRRMEESTSSIAPAIPQQPKERPDAKHHLKFTYGVNAWKHWVVGKNAELEKARAQGKYIKNFETDILKLRADELNYTLCMFVKEVKKPNGDNYAADSVLYLTYGIQEYLFENGRIDNIFTDQYYEPFTSALHEVVKEFKLPMNELGYYVTRIEEEHLWEAKQLGAHSPQVLLNTLTYFNTKFFMLRTADDHQKLSFTHIMKHWKKNSVKADGQKAIILRYYPPAKRGQRQEERKCYEQQECVESPLRCPVKLYEFYLSKCPENAKSRNDLFYLLPERSCVPDSPVWFSNKALPYHQIDKMLCRSVMVREVQEHMLADSQS